MTRGDGDRGDVCFSSWRVPIWTLRGKSELCFTCVLWRREESKRANEHMEHAPQPGLSILPIRTTPRKPCGSKLRFRKSLLTLLAPMYGQRKTIECDRIERLAVGRACSRTTTMLIWCLRKYHITRLRCRSGTHPIHTPRKTRVTACD